MKNLNYIIIFGLALSCANFAPLEDKDSRAPASAVSVFNSCKKGISSFFNATTEKQVKKVLLRLQEGGILNSEDKVRLSKLLYKVPFEQDRLTVARALKQKKSKLSKKELDIIRNFIGRDIMLKHNTDPALYKKLYIAGDENFPQTYGIEFELILDEVPAILNSYRIKKLTEQEWYSLGIEQRLKLAKDAQKNADDIDDIFVRLSSANPNLPKGLFIEPHGTIEGNGLVFENLGQLHELITYMSEHFGKFSWQTHLVVDANAEFSGMAGYSIFEFEKNQLQVLEKGFSRYLKNEKTIPSANLVHYSLGPIDQKIADRIIEADEFLENGIMNIKISGTKAVNAPHFRVGTPYGPGKMGFELRQYHKRYADMFDSLVHLAKDIDDFGNLKHYKDFSTAKQVSGSTIEKSLSKYGSSKKEIEDFQVFFLALSEEILKHNKKMGGFSGGADFEHRLLYPLKDWVNHPIRKTLTDLEQVSFDQVTKREQLRFISEIRKVMHKYDITEVTENTLNEVRVLIAGWAHKSDYSHYFTRFKNTARGSKQDLRYSFLPKLKFFDETSEEVYKFKRGLLGNFAYDNYLDSTVEIAFRDVGKTGHMEVRVGKKHYSINNVFWGNTMVSNTSFTGFKSGAIGRVFRFDRQKIAEVAERVEEYILSMKKNNFPPFDVWGSDELVRPVKRGFKMVDSKNKGLIKAQIQEHGGLKYFVNGSVKIPVVEKEGQLYIRTTNCAKGVTDILKDYLNFDIGNYASATILNNAFKNGTTKKIHNVEINY